MNQTEYNQNKMRNASPTLENGYVQNVVPTSTQANLAAAATERSYFGACLKFKALQYANNRGTTEEHYARLLQLQRQREQQEIEA